MKCGNTGVWETWTKSTETNVVIATGIGIVKRKIKASPGEAPGVACTKIPKKGI